MLSLIICSRNSTISKKLENNLRETILTDYELIVIDNSSNQFSIFEAYNIGIDRSYGEFLVFLHDDILFRTIGWGGVIKNIFKNNSDIGLLGVAGSNIKTSMPSTWVGPGKKYIRIIQHYNDNKDSNNFKNGFDTEELVEAATIDGVLMIMKRNEKIRFDENLKGYHNYDVDLSLKHHMIQKKVYVTSQILIEHFSSGTINKDWYLSTSRYHKAYYKKLPIIINSEITSRDFRNSEFITGSKFIIGLLDNNLRTEAFYWWFKLINMKFYSKFHFVVIKKILFD